INDKCVHSLKTITMIASPNNILLLLSGLLALRDPAKSLNALGSNSVLASLSGLLVLLTTGLGLVGKLLGAGVLDLLLEDELHEVSLVLEGVTLGAEVQNVVQVLVDLLGLSVLLQKAAEDAHASHPDNLLGHTGILGTETLSGASKTNFAASLGELTGTVTGVHSDGFADDKSVLHQTTYVLARVGVGDLVDLIGVEPYLSLSALEYGRREALLQAQITHPAACLPSKEKKEKFLMEKRKLVDAQVWE
ncbi:hypothetical protein PFISCL1PPCAC_24124, partial [Pristionchus fissidentatus]